MNMDVTEMARLGGRARARKLTKKQRKAIASMGGKARHAITKPKQVKP